MKKFFLLLRHLNYLKLKIKIISNVYIKLKKIFLLLRHLNYLKLKIKIISNVYIKLSLNELIVKFIYIFVKDVDMKINIENIIFKLFFFLK